MPTKLYRKLSKMFRDAHTDETSRDGVPGLVSIHEAAYALGLDINEVLGRLTGTVPMKVLK
jgi:hypothetical protein